MKKVISLILIAIITTSIFVGYSIIDTEIKEDIYYIDRITYDKIKEKVPEEKLMRWTHETKFGKNIIEMILKKKVISNIYGKFQDTKLSSNKIYDFIKEFNIDTEEFLDEKFNTFNEFFARKLKKDARPIDFNSNSLISPSDGKILAYENIDINKLIQIKGVEYSLVDLLKDIELAKQYEKGTYIVIRLTPSDYHRFHFVDSGIPLVHKKIDGDLYSVNPISLKKIANVYTENKRELTIFDSENFDDILFIEVGATFVGSIKQSFELNQSNNKGDEKGYFEFGGSTVIMVFKEGTVKIDEDIIENTLSGYETKIKFGEKIGEK